MCFVFTTGVQRTEASQRGTDEDDDDDEDVAVLYSAATNYFD